MQKQPPGFSQQQQNALPTEGDTSAKAALSSEPNLDTDLDRMQADRAVYQPPSLQGPEMQLGTTPQEVRFEDLRQPAPQVSSSYLD